MGTCISKCCLHSSPPNDTINTSNAPPQDKLVIHALPLSSSSSSSSSSSTTLSSSITATSTSSSSSSSSSTSKLKPHPGDLLLSSCAKEHPRIIILDPHKYDATKPIKPGNVPPIKPNQTVRLPWKRERSSSPQRSVSRQKSFRSDQIVRRVVSNPSPRLTSPSTVLKDRRRFGGMNNQKIRPSGACNSSRSRLNSTEIRRVPLVDDIDNPLISMECFIFL